MNNRGQNTDYQCYST